MEYMRPLASKDSFSFQQASSSATGFSDGAATMEESPPMETPKHMLRSCLTCSKAKAKCVRQPGKEICERCARLRKECSSREPTVRRKKHIKTTRAAQLEKLESKIEHLVNALSIAQAQREPNAGYGQPSPPASDRSGHGSRQSEPSNSFGYEEGDDDDVLQCPLDKSTSPTSPATFTTSGQTQSEPSVVNDHHGLGVSPQDAQILLDRFRRLMCASYPFIVIPKSATVRSLRAEKPLLLHAIVLVASFHDATKQHGMLKKFMRDMSERTMINGEKSLDIVQAILLVISFYYPYLFSTQQLTNLIHIAMAMLTDLGMDRPPMDCPTDASTAVATKYSTGPWKTPHGPWASSRVATLDELRTLAGMFYMTSMIATSFRKMDPRPYTKYLSESLDTLEKTREYESDILLVQLVRLQYITQDAVAADITPESVLMYIKSFIADHEKLAATPLYQHNNESNVQLKMQQSITNIMILELHVISLSEHQEVPNVRPHIDGLCQLADAMRDFMDLFFTIPVNTFLTLPFSVLGNFAHTFILMLRLVSLELDGLDTSDIHDRLDFDRVVDQIISRFDKSTDCPVDGIPVSNPCFSNWALRARWMKTIHDNRNAPKPVQAKLAALMPPSAEYVARHNVDTQGRWHPEEFKMQRSGSATTVVEEVELQQQQQQQEEAMAAMPATQSMFHQVPRQMHQQLSPEQLPMQTPQQTPPQMNHAIGQQTMQQAQFQPFNPGSDEIMSGDFFQYLDDNFWQNFAGDIPMGNSGFSDIGMAMGGQ